MKPLFEDPKEQALIEKVTLVFIEKGMKAMTMDDIAVELHVSKKTLYKYVKNRPELIKKCVQLQIHSEKENRSLIASQGLNAIEEKLKMTEYTAMTIASTHESMHSDLEKYFPDSFQLITDFKSNFLLNEAIKNIKKGIDEKLFCPVVNPKIIAKMFIAKIDLVFDGRTFPKDEFKFNEVLTQISTHHMRGMATQKGLDVLQQLTNQKFK